MKPLPYFTKRSQMRQNSMKGLGATQVPAEPGDHLIKDQEGAFLLAKLFDAAQVACIGRCGSLCLHYDAGDLARVPCKECAQIRKVVIPEFGGQLRDCRWDAAFTSVVPVNQSSMEKKGWSPQIATRSRPVYTCQFDSRRGDIRSILGEFHHFRTGNDCRH